jgi:hypothetical protein
MSEVQPADTSAPDRSNQAHVFAEFVVSDAPDADPSVLRFKPIENADTRSRRVPRVSVIVVLPEHHGVSPDRLAQSLRGQNKEAVDVVVACAGQPANLSALQRSIGDAQFLLAPAGTSVEDLRELAMGQVAGDIVTLVSGARLQEASSSVDMMMSS